MRWRWLLFCAIGLLCYANAMSTPFLFDDVGGIVNNQGARQLWPPAAVMNVGADETPWGRPLVAFSLATNYALGGLDVRGYHLVNLGIHIGAALVLFALLQRMLLLAPAVRERSTALAFIVALLWLVHPIATSVTTYTIQRAESLMALCYLSTMLLAVRSVTDTRPWVTGGAILFCALGMCSKESMVTAPLAVLALDLVLLDGNQMRRRRPLYVGLASTWLLLAILMWTWPRAASVGGDQIASLDYLLMQSQIIMHYLGLVLWPTALSLDYQWARVDLLQALPYGLLLTGALAVSLWLLCYHRSLWGYPGAFLFLVLAPTSSIIPIHTSVAADHRMYLPGAAMLALLVLLIDAALQRTSITDRLKPWAGMAMVTIVAAALAAVTIDRNRDYASPATMWRDVTQKQPTNPRGWNNLGGYHYQSGQHEQAFASFRQAVDLDPDYDSALTNLGTMLGQQGRLPAGIELLRRAVELNPAYLLGWVNLGLLAFEAGDLDLAATACQAALRLQPHEPTANRLWRDLQAVPDNTVQDNTYRP